MHRPALIGELLLLTAFTTHGSCKLGLQLMEALELLIRALNFRPMIDNKNNSESVQPAAACKQIM